MIAFVCVRRILYMCSPVQIPAVKQKQGNDTAADGSIGKVEDRTEEDEMVSAHQRHPVRPIGIDDGEIEHVHHFSVQQRFISFAPRDPFRDRHRGTGTEDFAVEYTVDDISDGTCQNQ